MNQRTAQFLAWSSAALAVLIVAAGLLLSLYAYSLSSGRAELAPHQFFSPLGTLTFSLVGALIVSRQPHNPIGWLLNWTGLLTSLNLLGVGYWMVDQVIATGAPLPGIDLALWVKNWVWIPAIMIPLTFLLLLFPDGKLLSSRWRPIAWAVGMGLTGSAIASALNPGDPGGSSGASAVEPTAMVTLGMTIQSGAWILLGMGFIGSAASLIVRFRRSSGAERDQLKWLVYAVALGLLINMAGFVLPSVFWPEAAREIGISTSAIAITAILAGVGIAIVRHHLYDIDILINRTMVYSALTALVAGLYLLVVGVLGALFQARGNLALSLIGVGLVAVVVQPLRERFQRGVNRLMYGERDEPYAILSRLGERLEGALAPDAMLVTLVETVAQSLKLPYAAIALGQGENASIAASHGQPVTEPERFPLIFQAESIGQLIVGPRASGEIFNMSEQNLLANIARQAGVAVHSAQLTVDLRRSRARLVTAREEERRRLRRDLHDGLGPILASQGLKLAAAKQLLHGDVASAEGLLDQVIVQNEGSVTEIRRLVYDLRPPALDERGLVEAVRDHVAGLDGKGASPGSMFVEIESVPDDLPPLPAAVEVAAYRIALEALTNVTHHARAQRCTICFEVIPENQRSILNVKISDDGAGMPASLRPGIGLRSMRERAEELSGSLTIESTQEGGTNVLAKLPLDGES